MTPVKAILTDIEGTTSAIHFVRQVLFPYSAQRLPGFIAEQARHPAVMALLTQAATLAQVPAQDTPAIINALLHWLATDQKITPLKTLQGMIWEQGYREGRYQAPLYADAAACLADWHQRGIPLAVYSSGSVQAQQLFFEFSEYGDVRPWFQAYFDTTLGAKTEPQSYLKIAQVLDWAAADILFLSDSSAELDAAQTVGLQTYWLVRPQDTVATPAQLTQTRHRIAADFYQVLV